VGMMFTLGFKVQESNALNRERLYALCEFMIDNGFQTIGRDIFLMSADSPGSKDELRKQLYNLPVSNISIRFEYNHPYAGPKEGHENKLTDMIQKELESVAHQISITCGNKEPPLDFYGDVRIGVTKKFIDDDPITYESIYEEFLGFTFSGDGYLEDVSLLDEKLIEINGLYKKFKLGLEKIFERKLQLFIDYY